MGLKKTHLKTFLFFSFFKLKKEHSIICEIFLEDHSFLKPIPDTGVGSGGGGARGACAPPTFLIGGGNGMFVPPPQLLAPHFYFPLELYVYITPTNNYLAFFIYQLIILWTISIN